MAYRTSRLNTKLDMRQVLARMMSEEYKVNMKMNIINSDRCIICLHVFLSTKGSASLNAIHILQDVRVS